MRITIGGVLLVVGVGAVAAVAFLPSGTAPAGLEKYLSSIREKADTSLGLFRSASGNTGMAPSPLTSPVEPVPTPLPEASPTPLDIPVAVVVPTEEPKATVTKKTRSRARRTRKKPATAKKTTAKTAAATPASPKPAAKAANGSLIGSYVVLTLTTGRDVKGILQEQDAGAYKVELPGLGTFTYPLQSVKSIRAGE